MVFNYLQIEAFVAWQLKIIVFMHPLYRSRGNTNPLAPPLYTPLPPFKFSSNVSNTLIHIMINKVAVPCFLYICSSVKPAVINYVNCPSRATRIRIQQCL